MTEPDVYSFLLGMRALAGGLPDGWSERPSIPTETSIDPDDVDDSDCPPGFVVRSIISPIPEMHDADARRRWHREHNGEQAVRLRELWNNIRSSFDDDLASRVDEKLQEAIGIQGRQSLDTLDQAEKLAGNLRELVGLIKNAPPKKANGADGDDKTQPSLDARALAVLLEHPDWTDTKIAEMVDCNRTSLYRCDRFRAARALSKADGIDSQARGSKSDGHVEAWEDGHDEDLEDGEDER